ncbi:MAG: hypothetical protein JKY22_07855 [Flavobacteriaceae bacterium]|nr:hypothetical protein [Flavobacteriaceae bacterium]
MKKIAIPFRAGIKVQLPKGEEKIIFKSDDFEMHKKIRHRGQAIVQSGLDIEHYVKEIIGRILFHENDNKEFLAGVLLDTSDCTFSAKRKILQSTLKHFNLLEPKEINELEECLSKVMKYRNAFAHGQISTIKPFTITYFEGREQIKELTEEYWEKLINYLDKAFELLHGLNDKLIEQGK